jgi:hypothetical protein
MAASFIATGMALGVSYQGPTVWSWLLGTVAVAFAVLTFVALLPGGGPDGDADDEPWRPTSDELHADDLGAGETS